ncbi:hypothetical protein LPJ61_005508 [Coemansia biformis]|uniref:PAS domain-containing protein n=1 Tax=Coemansia biformis TaxID=1286918 RepID=A0A9W7Y869_9FUNG|nr:hypothetical protein LPJ61_005508 [Coemansia biformis]
MPGPGDSDSTDTGVVEEVYRPSYIGIHTRDESTRVLYVTSGVEEAVGYRAEALINTRAIDFIMDQYDVSDLPWLYESKKKGNATDKDDDDDDETDMANAYVMYFNIKTADGTPILQRTTAFKCDNCVVYIGVFYPEVPYHDRHELEVRMLDGTMKQLNVTQRRKEHIVAQGNRPLVHQRRAPLYYSRSRRVKAAFVLENLSGADAEMDEAEGRLAGPTISFVTGSVSRLVDADTSDLMKAPFLKLVAPEDVLHASRFLDRLSRSTDVMFETFSLLQYPPVVAGDVAVADEDNLRVVVECLGASSQDGVVLLASKLHTVTAPKRDTMGNYIHSRVHEIDNEGGYISLAELISSDPDTSDAPDAWSQLL